MAGTTGLEPATSAVTGQHSNQLNYVPNRYFSNIAEEGLPCGPQEWKSCILCTLSVSKPILLELLTPPGSLL